MRRRSTVAALGEFDLIRRYFERRTDDAGVVIGVGDDAAVLHPSTGAELVLAVDMMVEGRHFLAGADPESLGHKILAVNLSDLAAMGARPRWALLGGALPDNDPQWLAAFTRGLFALADAHGVSLVGGDTTRGPRNLCLTIAGEVPAGQAIRRSGAVVGDDIWVSGTLGDAMLALAAIEKRVSLAGEAFAAAKARLERPVPRIALGQCLLGVASAMLDVSDGLTGDLSHILDASAVGACVELDAVPRSPALDAVLGGPQRSLALGCLLAGGDDYELCFTAKSGMRDRVLAASREAGVAVTRIGRITAHDDGLVVRDARGAPLDPLPRGFDHFA